MTVCGQKPQVRFTKLPAVDLDELATGGRAAQNVHVAESKGKKKTKLGRGNNKSKNEKSKNSRIIVELEDLDCSWRTEDSASCAL